MRRTMMMTLSVMALLLSQAPVSSQGGLVQVTPLGSVAGELCASDRAILFEDPLGIRILYDPGRTVDESDGRLGTVDVVLLSHVHADHLGDVRPARDPATNRSRQDHNRRLPTLGPTWITAEHSRRVCRPPNQSLPVVVAADEKVAG